MPSKSRGKYYSKLAKNINISITAYFCLNVSCVSLDLAHLALSSSAKSKMFKIWLVFSLLV